MSTTETGSALTVSSPELDARDVEYLVDQVEEVPAGLQHVAHRFDVLGVSQPSLEHLSEPQHGVERRAQLVTHPRKEQILGFVRCSSSRFRIADCLRHPDALRDVLSDRYEAFWRAVRIGHWVHGSADPSNLAVGADNSMF